MPDGYSKTKGTSRGLLEIVANELVELIDFSQLAQINRSFIPDNLREQESDLVFSVPLRSESETDELLIYILIEHQSTVDSTMGFRVLFYMIQIWDSQRREWESNNVPKSQWRFRPILPDCVLHWRTEMEHPADPQCNNGHPRYVFLGLSRSSIYCF